jgi:hypothetical protein
MCEATAARRTARVGVLICLIGLSAQATHAFATALPAGTDFQVNTFTSGNQYFGTWQGRRGIARDAAGNFVVVWQSVGQDGSGAGVFGQRFDRNAAKLGTEFQVNTHTTGRQGSYGRNDIVQIDVSMMPTGEFVVVWTDDDADDRAGVFAQRYDSAGLALGPSSRSTAIRPTRRNSRAGARLFRELRRRVDEQVSRR